MRGDFKRLDIPTAAAPQDGVAMNTEDLSEKWIQIVTAGATVGTVQLQGSIDEVNFVDIGAPLPLITPVFLEIPQTVARVRIQTTVTPDGGEVWLGSEEGRS